MGMVERGGRMAAQVIPNVRKETLRDMVLENVEPGAVVSTDEHAAKEWSWYDWRTGETFHTNSVEGFWRLFKASVRSTQIHISEKRMPAYLAEFCVSVESPAVRNAMFDLLISRV